MNIVAYELNRMKQKVTACIGAPNWDYHNAKAKTWENYVMTTHFGMSRNVGKKFRYVIGTIITIFPTTLELGWKFGNHFPRASIRKTGGPIVQLLKLTAFYSQLDTPSVIVGMTFHTVVVI